ILAKPLGRDGNIVHFALPAPNPALLKGLLDQVEQLRKIDPERVSKDPMVLRTVVETRRALEQGIPVSVDTRSGIIVAFTADKSPSPSPTSNATAPSPTSRSASKTAPGATSPTTPPKASSKAWSSWPTT